MPKADVGLRVIEFVHRLLQIDAEWTEARERGFTWWPGTFSQTVWAEPPYEDDGIILSRVHVQTDLLRGVPDTTVPALAPYMRAATLSGFVRDGQDFGVLRIASSFYVHEQIEDSLGRLLGLATAHQAATAHHLTADLARAAGGEPFVSGPPGGGLRTRDDDMVRVVESQIVPAGAGPSAFAGPEFAQAAVWLERQGFFTNADEEGLTSELPFGEITSVLTLKSGDPHPELGNGLTGRLVLPVLPGESASARAVEAALNLNSDEVSTHTDVHFAGSRCPTERGLAFHLFVPNIVGGPGWVTNFTFALARRAMWASRVFDQAFEPQGQSAMDQLAEQMAGLDDDEFQAVLDSIPPGEDRDKTIQALTAVRAAMRSSPPADYAG
jgi:hypothetical protein